MLCIASALKRIRVRRAPQNAGKLQSITDEEFAEISLEAAE